MDFHILIVIACVFLASLCSLLLINKFFKRKTFEEIIAEKKAMSQKLLEQTKASVKKPKKLQQLKKEAKRERKQRQKEQRVENDSEMIEAEESDVNSESAAEEDPPQGLSKIHVEFEPDPEVVTFSSAEVPAANNRRHSNSDKQKYKKGSKHAPKSGILLNKNDAVVVKETAVEEVVNNFEAKPPKDVIELKKQDKTTQNNKKEKQLVTKKEKELPVEQAVIVVKELKQNDEKPAKSSPKNQAAKNSKSQNKKQSKDSNITKELVMAENDSIGSQLLLNLFRRAELNRSEIQILIDDLLNRQQDMPSSHSEWSDDMCQKLKRQLEEKERLLSEEQEASIGIQAKLRELRTEINTERAQMSSTMKVFNEKMLSKDQSISDLQQDIQALNEKLNLERQQYQAKLLQAKQAGSQDMMAQLQLMQSELAHKDKYIGELTLMVNATRQTVEESQQKNDIIQNQLRALEQQREELEQVSNSRLFELEKAKTLETENAEYKVEMRNLQNALESSKSDLNETLQKNENQKSELTNVHNSELSDKQQQIAQLKSKNEELEKQLMGLSSQTSKEQTGLQVTLEAIKSQLAAKEQQVAEFNAKNAELIQQQTNQQQELKKLVENLKGDVASKQEQLQQVTQTVEKFNKREQELLQQLQEQREKNNQQEQILVATTQKLNNSSSLSATNSSSSSKDEQQLRVLFQRLYPEAVNACEGTALSHSFEQWVEQVLVIHVKQSLSKSNATASTNTNNISSSNKSTQSNNGSSNNHNNDIASRNSHNTNSETSASTTNSNSSSNGSSSSGESVEVLKLNVENAHLRAQIDNLKQLVAKTSNTLSDLEGHAREQEENWRSIVQSKDELIHSLQHSNGDQNI